MRNLILLFIPLIMSTHSNVITTQKTIILVHGAWYGGWCWYKVIPMLEEKGYKVIAPDLPGYGSDNTPSTNITLNDYVKTVVAAANTVEGKVVLVGHSMGGIVISQTAEVLGPDKVEKLIYLDAFLLKDGEAIFDQVEKINIANKNAADLRMEHSAAEFLVLSEDKKSCLMNPLMLKEMFSHDCPEEDITLSKEKLRWQPVACLATPLHATDARYGKIPKYFIRCTLAKDLDRRSIVQNMPCEKVYEIPSSHSVFFSKPKELTSLLVSIY